MKTEEKRRQRWKAEITQERKEQQGHWMIQRTDLQLVQKGGGDGRLAERKELNGTQKLKRLSLEDDMLVESRARECCAEYGD